MARISFEPRDFDNVKLFPVAASQTIADGDMLTVGTDGLVTIADASSAKLLGPCARGGAITTGGTVNPNVDRVPVHCDPRATFRCLCDNVDENVQAVVGDEVDLIGTTGDQSVNLGASSTDVFVTQEIGAFRDPTGLSDSTTRWCNGKEIFVKINDGKHCLGN